MEVVLFYSKKKSTQPRLHHPQQLDTLNLGPGCELSGCENGHSHWPILGPAKPGSFLRPNKSENTKKSYEQNVEKPVCQNQNEFLQGLFFKMAPDFTWVSCKQYKIWNLIWLRKVRSPAQRSGTARQFTGLLNWQYDCRLIHPSHHYWSSTRCPQKFP